MERHLSPRKTPLAHEWLARRDTRLDRARRALLITVDGRRSGAELAHLAQGLGLGGGEFDELDPLPRLLMGPGPINADPRVLRAMSMQLPAQSARHQMHRNVA